MKPITIITWTALLLWLLRDSGQMQVCIFARNSGTQSLYKFDAGAFVSLALACIYICAQEPQRAAKKGALRVTQGIVEEGTLKNATSTN